MRIDSFRTKQLVEGGRYRFKITGRADGLQELMDALSRFRDEEGKEGPSPKLGPVEPEKETEASETEKPEVVTFRRARGVGPIEVYNTPGGVRVVAAEGSDYKGAEALGGTVDKAIEVLKAKLGIKPMKRRSRGQKDADEKAEPGTPPVPSDPPVEEGGEEARAAMTLDSKNSEITGEEPKPEPEKEATKVSGDSQPEPEPEAKGSADDEEIPANLNSLRSALIWIFRGGARSKAEIMARCEQLRDKLPPLAIDREALEERVGRFLQVQGVE
jgi:hypothetical protein